MLRKHSWSEKIELSETLQYLDENTTKTPGHHISIPLSGFDHLLKLNPSPPMGETSIVHEAPIVPKQSGNVLGRLGGTLGGTQGTLRKHSLGVRFLLLVSFFI
jgi:hypothetical protein